MLKRKKLRGHLSTNSNYEFTLFSQDITVGDWNSGKTVFDPNTFQTIVYSADYIPFLKWYTGQAGGVSPYNNGSTTPNSNYEFTVFLEDITVGDWNSGKSVFDPNTFQTIVYSADYTPFLTWYTGQGGVSPFNQVTEKEPSQNQNQNLME